MTINDVKPAKLLMLPVEINNKKIRAMMDTGSNSSYIRSNVVEELNMKINTEKKCIIGYGNKKMETEGTVTIQLKIENKFNVANRGQQ